MNLLKVFALESMTYLTTGLVDARPGDWSVESAICSVTSDVRKRAAADKLFQEIGPRFAKRVGGYTRILKTGYWVKGDGSKHFFVPKLCNHCAHSPCVQVCPVGATFESPDGVVLVDKDYCLGCRYCIQACPYACRFIDPRTGRPTGRTTAAGWGYVTLCLLLVAFLVWSEQVAYWMLLSVSIIGGPTGSATFSVSSADSRVSATASGRTVTVTRAAADTPTRGCDRRARSPGTRRPSPARSATWRGVGPRP